MQHQVDILFVINDLKFLKSHRIDLIKFLVSKGLKVSVATNLEGANLRGANLRWANLKKTNMKNTNLVRADLLKAELKDTLLQGANLKMAEGITSEQLKGAVTNGKTVLPEYLRKN